MQHYDFAFSCGFSCGVTQALREADLQFASFPFDWTASPSLVACAQMVAADFANWMERSDLELVDVRRGGINKHIYRNRRTGFGFVHDFSSFHTFEENFPKESEKYARRIVRLRECLSAAKRVLAVAAECPILPRTSDQELAAARQLLAEKYPNATFDVLYFYCEPGVQEPRVISSADGITVVANDYRTFVDGEVNHEIDHRAFTEYLKAQVQVTDPRSAAEKAKYFSEWSRQDRARWQGKNFWETMVNRTAFRIYRKLEKFLIRKQLVPPERPLWFKEKK